MKTNIVSRCPRWHLKRKTATLLQVTIAVGVIGLMGCGSGPKYERIRLDDSPNAYRSDTWTLRSTVTVEKLGAGLRCVVTGAPEPTATPYGGIMFPGKAARKLRLDMAFTEPEAIVSVFVDGYNAQKKRVVRWQADPRGRLRRDCVTYVFSPDRAFEGFKPVASEDSGAIDKIHLFVRVKPGSGASFDVHEVALAR